MAAKSISEADGKAILNYHLTRAPVIKPSPLPKFTTHNPPPKLASLYFPEDADVDSVLDQAESIYPWLLTPGAKFVAKPDQLIKRRGKSGLLALNKTWAEAKAWIAARAGKPQQVETVVGVLRQFLVEPFVPHPAGTEYYVNIHSVREVRDWFSSVLWHCQISFSRKARSTEGCIGVKSRWVPRLWNSYWVISSEIPAVQCCRFCSVLVGFCMGMPLLFKPWKKSDSLRPSGRRGSRTSGMPQQPSRDGPLSSFSSCQSTAQ